VAASAVFWVREASKLIAGGSSRGSWWSVNRLLGPCIGSLL